MLLAIATIPVAILANGSRVAGTGAAAHQFGPEAAQGFLHMFSGWFVFVAACVMLVFLHRLLAWLFPLRESTRPAVLTKVVPVA